jgi:formylglycine-generating enzyme required for sulfatase activity
MVQATVTIDLVPVGNINNANDSTTGYGAVDYNYSIGKCEISAGQYTEFLNSVAGSSDPYGLYNPNMATTSIGSKITLSGGVYTAALPNQPANWVSWGDAARFCNWLQTGATETGAYTLDGHTDSTYLMTVTRNAGATFFIPTENEWYKAAYFDPNKGGVGVGGYWLYPTKSDTPPINTLPDTGNNANFSTGSTTAVDAFADSKSAYGTLSQGGNVWEWNETAIGGLTRGLRGGSFNYNSSYLASTFRGSFYPTSEYNFVGFRVASVPEPGSVAMLLGLALTAVLYGWRRCV